MPLLDAEGRFTAIQLRHDPPIARQVRDRCQAALDVLYRALVGVLNQHPAPGSRNLLTKLHRMRNGPRCCHGAQPLSRLQQLQNLPLADPEVFVLPLATQLVYRHACAARRLLIERLVA